MRSLKKYPFFLVLLPIFFCLHGWTENYSSISFGEVFFVGLSILIVIAILFLIVYFFTTKYLYSALITVFISVWYFFFGAIHDFIKSVNLLSFLKHYTTLLPVLVLASLIWILFLRQNRAKFSIITLYLNALLIIYCVIDLAKLIIFLNVKSTAKEQPAREYASVKQKPNVYFLLFDGYPGQKTLTDSFNYDNKDFTSFLEFNQFKSLPIHSNYDYTLYSMSSIFNMQYVNNNYKVNEETQKDGQLRQNEIKRGAVFDIFESIGYKIVNHSVFDIKSLPGLSDENSFLLGHSILLTNKILINRIRKDLTFLFTDDQIKYLPFLKNQSVFIDRNNNLKAEALTIDLAGKKNDAPIFCYSHFLMPHAPYFYDSLGRETDHKKMTNFEVLLNKPNFISYLKYTNKVAQNIIASIRSKDSGAIIILISDHGVRTFPRQAYKEEANFDNICYVHFPNKNYFVPTPTFTNVNIFRYLLNSQFNQKLPYLKDTSFTYIPSSKKQ